MSNAPVSGRKEPKTMSVLRTWQCPQDTTWKESPQLPYLLVPLRIVALAPVCCAVCVVVLSSRAPDALLSATALSRAMLLAFGRVFIGRDPPACASYASLLLDTASLSSRANPLLIKLYVKKTGIKLYVKKTGRNQCEFEDHKLLISNDTKRC